jgi:hypothetical protein
MLHLFLFSTLQKITAQQHGLNCKLQMEEEKNINNQNMLAPKYRTIILHNHHLRPLKSCQFALAPARYRRIY